MRCSSGRAVRARVIWRRPSDRPQFSRAIVYFIRETHILLDELADAVADGSRKEFMESLATVPLLIIDDFGHAQTAVNGGRRSAGDRDAPATERASTTAHVEPPG